jgi:hypothetical protein
MGLAKSIKWQAMRMAIRGQYLAGFNIVDIAISAGFTHHFLQCCKADVRPKTS